MAEVWPFRPITQMTEVLDAATDVMRTGTKEMRVSLRNEPRQGVSYGYSVRNRMMGQIVDSMRTGMMLDWLVPIWFEASLLTAAVASGTPTLQVDTRGMELEAGMKVLIWNGIGQWKTGTILSFTDDTITLTANFGAPGYPRGFVVPLKTGYMTNGMEYARLTRGDGNLTNWGNAFTATLTFMLRDKGLPGVAPSLTFEDYPVVPDCHTIGEVSASIGADINYIDNQAGPVVLELIRDLQSVRYQSLARRRAGPDVKVLRSFLRWANGRDQSFYLADWTDDFRLSGSLLASDTIMSIKQALKPVSRLVNRVVYLDDGTGSPIIRRVTGAADSGPNQNLTIAAPGRDLPVTTRATMMRLVRLDSDQINLSHSLGFYAETTLPFIEVPE